MKLTPVTATTVPPAALPPPGAIPLTAGAYANWSAGLVAEVPAGVVTVMSTVPAPAGLVAVIWVSESTVMAAALAVPKATLVAPVKPLPEIVTVVPPAGAPVAGLTEFTIGTVGLKLPVIINSGLELYGCERSQL